MPLDCFKILQMPRQPWLEEADVRNRFHQLAAAAHPDSGAGSTEEFANLNHAWQTLRSPASRLRHYLELEYPDERAAASFAVPASQDLFMQVSELKQTVDRFVAERADSKSPLARALLEPRRQSHLQYVERLEGAAAAEIAAVHQRIQQPQPSRESLTGALNDLMFLEKWAAQLRETRLALG
jgi:hypothetical protein